MKKSFIIIMIFWGILIPAISHAFVPWRFTVNTNLDAYDVHPGDGICDIDEGTAGAQCTLRAAIHEANVHPGRDIIDFRIPWSMAPKIVLVRPMLEIREPVVIDATGQPPVTPGVPQLELDLNSQYGGLMVTCGNTEIRGLLLRGNAGQDVITLKDKGGNLIAGNYIGVEKDGKTASGFCRIGIYIQNSPDNIIGGTDPLDRNLISGCSPYGILIQEEGAVNNRILGNIIGPDITGTSPLVNQAYPGSGICIMSPASQNIVGGTEPGAGNLISNNKIGIIMQKNAFSDGTWGNRIMGNLIGTDMAGGSGLPNNIGLFIGNSRENLIGGTESGAGNVISGNTQEGICIMGEGADTNTIKGNYIGTDVTGGISIPNGGAGVRITESGNIIGGSGPGDGNLISGNGGPGVFINGASAVGNQVRGNIIGADTSGIHALPNEWGVMIDNGNDTIVGGAIPQEGNTIVFNLLGGVAVKAGTGGSVASVSDGDPPYDSGISNQILSNRIYANGGLGIDLIKTEDPPGAKSSMEAGPTPNDLLDEDQGPNTLQNFPEITGFENGEIQGNIHTSAGSNVYIQCFASPACDGSGYGEGRTWIGQASVVTDSSGNADFTLSPGLSFTPGTGLSATATLDGNTSEFSLCFEIKGQGLTGDLDQDRDVDGQDLLILISEFGRQNCTPASPCQSDIDGNGRVDGEDLRRFSLEYGGLQS